MKKILKLGSCELMELVHEVTEPIRIELLEKIALAKYEFEDSRDAEIAIEGLILRAKSKIYHEINNLVDVPDEEYKDYDYDLEKEVTKTRSLALLIQTGLGQLFNYVYGETR